MLDALEGHQLEEDASLCIPAELPDYCEFCGQHLDESSPESLARRILPPRRHNHQGCPEFLPLLIVLDPPTEVRSIVGVNPFPVYLPDTPVLPHGYAPRQITHGPLPVRRLVCLFPCCCRCRRTFDCVFLS